MTKVLRIGMVLVLAQAAALAQDAQQEIKSKTKKFTEAIVSKDLSILDQAKARRTVARVALSRIYHASQTLATATTKEARGQSPGNARFQWN